eukprot:9138654-Pyramimonas_sp.AAC.1
MNQARTEAGRNTMNGRITTVNTDASGPLLQHLEQARDAAILVQEHKADHQMLPKLHRQIQATGYHGAYAAAGRTEADGLSAGVAALVPTFVVITAPPLLSSPTLWPARAVAAQANWGCKGGVYLGRLNSRSRPWVVGGDWNLGSYQLRGQQWLEQIQAVFSVPAGGARRVHKEAEGRTYDWLLLNQALASRAGAPVILDDRIPPAHSPVAIPCAKTDNDIWLRLPVEPRRLPKGPHVGCSRYPVNWVPVMRAIED